MMETETTRRKYAARGKISFPLPPDVLPQLHLTQGEIRAIEAKAQRHIQDGLKEFEDYESFGADSVLPPPWELGAQAEGLKFMRQRDREISNRYHYRVHGLLVGNFRNMMEYLYSETSEQLFEWHQFMFGSMLDARVLSTFRVASPEHPQDFFGIVWLAFKPVPWLKLHTSYVHYITYVKDRRGREVGVRLCMPYDVPQLSVLMDEMGVKRFDEFQLHMQRRDMENQPGMTRMYCLITHDHPSSNEPIIYAKFQLNMYRNMALYAESRKIAQQQLMPRSAFKGVRVKRPDCSTCRRTFGITRRRSHCRMCGAAICHACAVVRSTAAQSEKYAFKLEKSKFCVSCITKVRENDETCYPPNLGWSYAESISSSAYSFAPTVASKCHSDPERQERGMSSQASTHSLSSPSGGASLISPSYSADPAPMPGHGNNQPRQVLPQGEMERILAEQAQLLREMYIALRQPGNEH